MTNAPLPTTPPTREIKQINPKEFSKGAEQKEKLMAILRDVPALHERMKKAVESVEKASVEFMAATETAKAIVTEWEKLNKEGA